MTQNTADINTATPTEATEPTNLTQLAADADLTVNPNLTDAEQKELEDLLIALFGSVPTAPDDDYLDSGAPTTEEYQHNLTSSKVIANESRVLVVIGHQSGDELVYDFRLEDGKIATHRADKAPARIFTEGTPPVMREVNNATKVSWMYDNQVLSLVIEDADGNTHGFGIIAENQATIAPVLNYTRDKDGKFTDHEDASVKLA